MSVDLYDLEAMKLATRYHADLIKRIETAQISGCVADIGAGIGLYASAWRAKTGQSPLCVEIEPYFIEALARDGFDVHTSIDTLPQELDAAYSINVLEHIEHPVPFLQGLHRKLKRGARIYIYVPAFSCLYSEWDKRVGHYRRFDLDILEENVASAGFKVINKGYADSLGFVATWILKKLGKTGGAVTPRSVVIYDGIIFPVSRLLDHVVSRWFGKNCWVIAQAM